MDFHTSWTKNKVQDGEKGDVFIARLTEAA